MISKFYIFFIILIGVGIYTATLRGIPGNLDTAKTWAASRQELGPFESSRERVFFVQLLAYHETGRMELTREMADVGAPDVGYSSGHFYSLLPVGLPLIIYPFFLLGLHFNLAQVFTFFSISLFAVGSMILLFKIAHDIFKLSSSLSFLASIIFGFATTAWSYSITLYQVLITVFLLLLSFYSVSKYREEKKYSWFWATLIWGSYALSIFIDYPNAILFLPIIVYFLISSFIVTQELSLLRIRFRSTILFTSIIFVTIMGYHLYSNHINYGNWKTLTNIFVRYDRGYEDLQKKLQNQTENPEEKLSSGFQEKRIPYALFVLLFSSNRGLFFFSPILILGVLGIFIKKIDTNMIILLVLVFVNLLFYASFSDFWGGRTYGPRYLIPSMAMLSIFSVLWINHVKNKFLSYSFASILLVYSIAVALLGALTTNMLWHWEEYNTISKNFDYSFNLELLKANKSGSFVYNTYLAGKISLVEYFFIIYGMLLAVFAVVLFILPYFERETLQLRSGQAGSPQDGLGVNKKIPIVPAKERPKKLRIKVV